MCSRTVATAVTFEIQWSGRLAARRVYQSHRGVVTLHMKGESHLAHGGGANDAVSGGLRVEHPGRRVDKQESRRWTCLHLVSCLYLLALLVSMVSQFQTRLSPPSPKPLMFLTI